MAPPCIRQRLLPLTAGAWQGRPLPVRVRTPHRGALTRWARLWLVSDGRQLFRNKILRTASGSGLACPWIRPSLAASCETRPIHPAKSISRFHGHLQTVLWWATYDLCASARQRGQVLYGPMVAMAGWDCLWASRDRLMASPGRSRDRRIDQMTRARQRRS